MNVIVHDRDNIEKSIDFLIENISIFLKNSFISSISKDLEDNAVQNLVYYRYFKKRDPEQILLDIVLRSAILCESRSPGSGEIYLTILSDLFCNLRSQGDISNRLESIDNTKIFVSATCKLLDGLQKKPDKNDIENLCRDMIKDENLSSLIFNAIRKSSPQSIIDVKKVDSIDDIVLFDSGNSIDIENIQVQQLKINSWTRSSVKCIAIDGKIETIGEIHHILQSASEERSPHLILCRNVSQEIRDVICHNVKRGTVDVFIAELDFKPETVHFFADLKILLGCDIVDPIIGDTISLGFKYKTFNIEKVIIKKSLMTIYQNESKNTKRVSDHISYLVSQKSESDDLSVERLIDKRIRFFSSDTTSILIGHDTIRRDKNAIKKTSSLIRSIPDFINFGLIEVSIEDNLDIIEKIIKNTERTIFSQKELFDSFVSACKTFELLSKSERLLTADKT